MSAGFIELFRTTLTLEDNQPNHVSAHEDNQPNQSNVNEDKQTDLVNTHEDNQPNQVNTHDSVNTHEDTQPNQINVNEDKQPDSPNAHQDKQPDLVNTHEDKQPNQINVNEDKQPDLVNTHQNNQPEQINTHQDKQPNQINTHQDKQPNQINTHQDKQPDLVNIHKDNQPDQVNTHEDNQPNQISTHADNQSSKVNTHEEKKLPQNIPTSTTAVEPKHPQSTTLATSSTSKLPTQVNPPSCGKGRFNYFASCCKDSLFCCRFHHDSEKESDLHPFKSEHIICLKCQTKQLISTSCTNCNAKFGEHICKDCPIIFPNSEIFHCKDCGCCRMGSKSEYNHCKDCNKCVKNIKKHRCYGETTCPICFEDTATSYKKVVGVSCKHIFHEECLLNWAKRSTTCPVCRTSIRKKRHLWWIIPVPDLIPDIPYCVW